jgi:hypothetical protein
MWKVEVTVGFPVRYRTTLGRGMNLDEANEVAAQAREELDSDGGYAYSGVDVKVDDSDWYLHPPLEVGERVRYTVEFARNVFGGSSKGLATNEPRVHSTATVLSVKGKIVEVEWDCGGVDRINAANLGRLATPRTCAC